MNKDVRDFLESVTLAVVVALLIVNYIGQLFLVQGTSMEPSLQDGQRVVVDKISLRFRKPDRGEIIVFRWPQDPKRKFIKRAIGLPGDEVLIRQNTVYINRRKLSEDYINGPTYGDFGPETVPEGHYFLLGDNRNYSDDSRFPDVGMVPKRLLVGRALMVIWPLDNPHIIRIPEQLQKFATEQ